MVTPNPRVATDALADDVHGGADSAELEELGLRPDQVLDFSANLSPFGPSPMVHLAVRRAALDRYPDRTSRELRRALATRHGVREEQVLVGNGSSELIWLAAVAYLAAGDGALILGPAFSGYEQAARLMGATVWTCKATSEDGFCPPLAAFAKELSEREPRVAFLASPNNPTGQTVESDRVFALAAQSPRTLFVFDEAYADSEDPDRRDASDPPQNVLRLRSLTKAHGLAGVRLGYGVGNEDVIAAIKATQPPWSVNTLAQEAGLAALADGPYVKDCLVRWAAAKTELVAWLRQAGFAPVPSTVPFFLMPVADAAHARSALLRRGILVRDCTSFSLPHFVRISSRGKDENARLVDALLATRAEVVSCNG
jgi:histidinol-phosphate aminotransferase